MKRRLTGISLIICLLFILFIPVLIPTEQVAAADTRTPDNAIFVLYEGSESCTIVFCQGESCYHLQDASTGRYITADSDGYFVLAEREYVNVRFASTGPDNQYALIVKDTNGNDMYFSTRQKTGIFKKNVSDGSKIEVYKRAGNRGQDFIVTYTERDNTFSFYYAQDEKYQIAISDNNLVAKKSRAMNRSRFHIVGDNGEPAPVIIFESVNGEWVVKSSTSKLTEYTTDCDLSEAEIANILNGSLCMVQQVTNKHSYLASGCCIGYTADGRPVICTCGHIIDTAGPGEILEKIFVIYKGKCYEADVYAFSHNANNDYGFIITQAPFIFDSCIKISKGIDIGAQNGRLYSIGYSKATLQTDPAGLYIPSAPWFGDVTLTGIYMNDWVGKMASIEGGQSGSPLIMIINGKTPVLVGIVNYEIDNGNAGGMVVNSIDDLADILKLIHKGSLAEENAA